jgi:hypothetical protein
MSIPARFDNSELLYYSPSEFVHALRSPWRDMDGISGSNGVLVAHYKRPQGDAYGEDLDAGSDQPCPINAPSERTLDGPWLVASQTSRPAQGKWCGSATGVGQPWWKLETSRRGQAHRPGEGDEVAWATPRHRR